MEPKITHLHPQQVKNSNLESKTSTFLLCKVFEERSFLYINEYNLFIANFKDIPSVIDVSNIDFEKAQTWFAEKYKSEINQNHFTKNIDCEDGTVELGNAIYVVNNEFIVSFNNHRSKARFLFRNTQMTKVNEAIIGVKEFKINCTKKPQISIIVSTSRGLETLSMEVQRPKLKIDDNYNDDFKEVNQIIKNRLSKKNDKGLVLLHGKPGTGKTNYIRYLIYSIKKKVIFLPPNMASAITDPNFIPILMQNPNSVLVIEDAEKIIMNREDNSLSPVTSILNITDGLLSDFLNIQIICSFNTDISKIDNALIRKGRLIAKYEFKELQIPKAIKLSEKLGHKTIVSAPMTLSAIYNIEEKEYHPIKRKTMIGYITNANEI